MTQWKPIETAPKDKSITALVFDGSSIELASRDAGDDYWWVLLEYTVEPTHWMPLPAPLILRPTEVICGTITGRITQLEGRKPCAFGVLSAEA